jgi:hypothetical protein
MGTGRAPHKIINGYEYVFFAQTFKRDALGVKRLHEKDYTSYIFKTTTIGGHSWLWGRKRNVPKASAQRIALVKKNFKL